MNLAPALCLALACLAASPAAQDTRRPNVVVVLVDDLGWTDLSCQGSKVYETPNVDRLAQDGIRFTNGYAACAVCSPTRAAVMTGRYPARTRVTDWIRARFQRGNVGTPAQSPTEYVGGRDRKLLCPPNPYWMELEEVTIAEVLREHGYRTGYIGKWHLGDDAWYPTEQGFDENFGGCDYGQPPSYFDPYTNRRLQQGIPHLKPRKAGEYLTDREADEAVAFIGRNKDRPFFLQLAHYAVHTPIQAKDELTSRYAAKIDELGKPAQTNAKYAAMVHSVDAAMGRVLAALDEHGIADRTMVVFTSDNGGLLGPTDNAPLRSGKGFPYEGGIRVPFVVRWPGVVGKGRVSDAPVCSVDLFPTILAAAGIEAPKGRAIDGVSLVPHLRGGAAPAARDLFWHFPHYRGQVVPYSIVRRGSFKLIKRYEGPTFELFDLAADLAETRDLAREKPELVRELDRALVAHLEEAGARLPRPNPRYTPPDRGRPRGGGPNVLILGDSISMGYTEHVRKALEGTAQVFRPMRNARGAENCQGTNHGVKRIDAWLAAHGGRWDVIHFNFGLHDLKRVDARTGRNSNDPKDPRQAELPRYEAQLRAIVKKLVATGATLIFATTTPVPEGVRPWRDVGDPERYNEVARKIMREHGIAVDDLYAFAAARIGEIQRPRDVHFTPKGSAALGAEVVRHIRQALQKRKKQ